MGFTPASNVSEYCGHVSYSFQWLTASNGVVAFIDEANYLINI